VTAFVRERAPNELKTQVRGESVELYRFQGTPDRTDVTAVLTVLMRRDKRGHQLEGKNDWRLDLGNANLRLADFSDAKLSHVDFLNADLTLASFDGADLRGVNLTGSTSAEPPSRARSSTAPNSARRRILRRNNSIQPLGIVSRSFRRA
jgi:hypothetical protein